MISRLLLLIHSIMDLKSKYIGQYTSVFEKYGLPWGRLMAPSKEIYFHRFPVNKAFFNASIVLPNVGRVWWGDVDITREGKLLMAISKEIGENLYIIKEEKYQELHTKNVKKLVQQADHIIAPADEIVDYNLR